MKIPLTLEAEAGLLLEITSLARRNDPKLIRGGAAPDAAIHGSLAEDSRTRKFGAPRASIITWMLTRLSYRLSLAVSDASPRAGRRR